MRAQNDRKKISYRLETKSEIQNESSGSRTRFSVLKIRIFSRTAKIKMFPNSQNSENFSLVRKIIEESCVKIWEFQLKWFGIQRIFGDLGFFKTENGLGDGELELKLDPLVQMLAQI